MNVWGTLERARELHPRREALVDGELRLTYAQVHARSSALAAWLCAQGIRHGDRLAILAWNGHAFLESYYAAAGVGAVLVPLNVRASAAELGLILRDSGARLLIADASLGELAAGALAVPGAHAQPRVPERVLWIGAGELPRSPLPAESYARALETPRAPFAPACVSPSALAHLYYTSGTTGRPKGVMLTHRNVCVHALGTLAELGLSERDRWAHIAPMFHLADAWATFAITWAGGTHVMLPRFEARAALDLLQDERVTLTNLVPSMLAWMLAHDSAAGRTFPALRTILSGGAPIAPALVRRIVATFGCTYVQTYGMTETSPYLTLSLLKEHLRALPFDEQLAYSAKTGRPFVAVELEVVDERGVPVPRDEQSVGEIRVRGETVTPGYWNRPDETAAAFEDGWLKTGDLAVIDAEGYVTIVDRKKDMIITGGEKVYSIEVESALCAHADVLEAAVFATPDEQWGELVSAAVVLKAGRAASAAQLIEHCRAHLSAYKVPRVVRLVGELPRTGSGKVVKARLRPPSPGRS